eukprot:CAMPEP_0114588008 /NCGR_PEP_ID=MMETSP0125-20121206/10824_1 /TAXON_ID=485358 ORGANISM="Aristerostoma sp., Strain ATCC 50986" /NCGR_SAMPLE_ID=MMETSP0125 /ASSEMBLY_ACC=CAM_ASM_000245 /LENGTH=46 /DNA_ID= /DNA_START= /DNA_END= /DNA_ORIENTATION=
MENMDFHDVQGAELEEEDDTYQVDEYQSSDEDEDGRETADTDIHRN